MDIFLAREKRNETIKKLITEYSVIVSLKGNIPGENKNVVTTKRLMYVIDKELKNVLPFNKKENFESEAGDYKLYLMNHVDPAEIKTLTIKLEETHPLGRFVDIDVYTNKGQVSRTDLGYEKRKCMICDDNAFICMKENRHTLEEVKDVIEKTLKNFFESTLKKGITYAFERELNLHPKFGLVTPYSSGSHSDMNYEIMVKSHKAIIPYLVKMYDIGYETDNLDEGFKKIRKVGIDAETKMLMASGGVNTYKGAIFLLGIFSYALGYFHQTLKNNVREIIKYICRDILNELKENPDTFGIEAYQKYNVYTARHEVYYGLPSVLKAYYYLKKFPTDDDKALTMTLINIISNKNDTVGLKRAKSFDKYFEVSNKIEKIKTYDKEKIEKITNECIENHISFGGSADVLIATILIYYLIKQNLLE